MFGFGRSEGQKTRPCPQGGSAQSWCPASVGSSSNYSIPATPVGTSSSSHRPTETLQSPPHVSPAEAAGVIVVLKDKSSDDLCKLLSDKDAYKQFLLSLDQVKIQNNLKNDICKENSQLTEENLQKEPCIFALRNQCRIIRTTELAAAQDFLNELEKQKEETLKSNSLASLLQRVQEAMNKTEEESEDIQQQLLDREIDLGTFLHNYKKLRTTYHRKALIHLAATSSTM